MMPPPPDIFNRRDLQRARARCARNFADHDFLFSWTEEHIAERLQDIKRDFTAPSLRIGQIGTRSGGAFKRLFPDSVVMDFSFETPEILPAAPESFDLILSALDLHSLSDLTGGLIQIRKALKPGGVFLGAFLGGETLHALRASLMQAEIMLKGGASPRIFPFADKAQIAGLLGRAGFALPVVDSEILTVTYRDMFTLMHDLRGMGEGNILNARSKNFAGKDFFKTAEEYYKAQFGNENGPIEARFEVIFVIGWAEG